MSHRDPPLRLDDRFTHLVSVDEAVVLVGDDDAVLLDATLAADVARLLDGRRTAVQVAESLHELHRPELVHFLLLKMEREGLIHTGPGAPAATSDSGDEHAWPPLAAALHDAWMDVARGPVVRLPLDGAFGDGAELLVTDDYLSAALTDTSLQRKLSPAPYLLARVGRQRVWMGPWIVPGESACVGCLQERLRVNLAARSLLHLPRGMGTAGLRIERLARDVPREAFTRLARAVEAEGGPGGPMSLTVLPLDGGSEERHGVARLPQCPACGDPALAPPGADVRLRSRPRRGRTGGGHRAVHPEETLRRLTPLISPLTGVVRHVRKVPVEGCEIAHVYTANHAHCFGGATLGTLRADRRDHSGGKGMTDLDARVSAVCESVERYSSVYRGSEPIRRARLSELGPEAIHPNELLGFSEAQYQGRSAWNEKDPSGFQWVPEPYRDEAIEWSPALSLVTGHTRLVPSAAVYLGFTGEGRRFCKGDSNGLASGNCVEEAILQAFLEVAERDGIALWWYNRALRPGVDLESYQDARVQETRALYPTLDRSLWVLDLTSDLEVPTFVALSSRLEGPPEDIIFGFGAHLDADIALLRALSEINQMLPTVIRSPEERRRQLLPDFADAIRWWESETLQGHPYLLPDVGQAPRVRSDFPRTASSDLLDDVHACVARARSVGCDVLVHDLTRPDVDFPVARVLVPGLRHFWRRLGPGRLYDVPLRLGWTSERSEEGDMNPISMFV